MSLRLRLDGFRLDDLQPDGIGGVVHRGDYREFLIRGSGQGRARGRRLDQSETIFSRDEKVFGAFLHHSAAGNDLYQQKGCFGLLCGSSQNFWLEMCIGLVSEEDNVRLLIDDHFCNASLAFQGCLNGSPARPSERAVGACRRFLHLGMAGRTGNDHQSDCQDESRVDSHFIAPFP